MTINSFSFYIASMFFFNIGNSFHDVVNGSAAKFENHFMNFIAINVANFE